MTGHPPIIDDHGENLLTVQSHPSVSKDGKQEVPIIIVGEQSATLPSETGMKEVHRMRVVVTSYSLVLFSYHSPILSPLLLRE